MRIFFYLFLFNLIFNSYSLSDTRFEKDLKKLSKYNFFVNNEGNRYELDQNIDKDKTIILIYSHGSAQDVFRFIEAGTELIEIEMGRAENESGTIALQKAIESALLDIVNIGYQRGYWKYE